MNERIHVSGRVMHIGDDVSTDLIYPARYMPLRAPAEQAAHALEGLGEEVRQALADSSVLVAGWNLGCGSSREQAATALRHAGIKLVVARSFARIFFRNCINTGLPVIQSEALCDALAPHAQVEVDVGAGVAVSTAGTVSFTPLPAPLLDILRAGGLFGHLKQAQA